MADGPELLAVAGARNLRDIGGCIAADGRRVRRGMIMRAGHPGELTEQGQAQFAALGICSILDLRTTEERAEFPYPGHLVTDVRYWARDYDLSRGDIVAMLRDPATRQADMHAHMLDSYRRLLSEQRLAASAMFEILLAGQTPLLINCTAGKDRTGVLVALLLSALGVSREAIRSDYVLTERVQDPGAALFHVDPEGPFAYLLTVDPMVWRTMMRAAPEYIDAMFASLAGSHGSVEAFLADTCGMDADRLEQLRMLLLEG
ncbi:MAG: tyrosine-protein phosphatase [Blastomonas sp.]